MAKTDNRQQITENKKQNTANKPKAKKSSSSGQQTATHQPKLTTKLTWLPKKTFELEFTIPWAQVKNNYDKTLKQAADETTIKGFRKGKAPLQTVEKNIDKSKIYSQVLQNLLPQTYSQSVNQHNLRPICDPQVQPLKTEEGKDWSFKATACEAPQVNLGNYEQEISGAKAIDKIWVPGKDQLENGKGPREKAKSEEQKLKEIFDILLKKCKIELPPMLVDTEEKRMLSRLLEQINKLGLTLDEYLASNNKTAQQLRTEHQALAIETLSLEFILQKIAIEKNIKVEENEIDAMINAIPYEQTRETFNNPMQRGYISSLIRKRKVIDFLKKL